jgi:DNA-binding beta-propeller fold protein YncE|tara:strand:- start:105 stop:818 length:714 start_codon:yes stop_codon:yes gene_type:complete
MSPHKVADPIQIFIAPGTKPNGIQAAEDGLWIIDQDDNFVYKIDWTSGKTLNSFNTDTVHSSGITIGGGYIWVSSTYSCEIFQLEIETGKTVEKYPSPGGGINATREHLTTSSGRKSEPTGDHGLEWKDNCLYVASPPSQFVHVIDTTNWKEIHKMKAPGFRVHGIAWAEEENHVWIADTAFGVVSRHRLEDGRCYDAFRVPDPVQVHGLTIKDNILWYADDRGPIGKLSVSMDPDF